MKLAPGNDRIFCLMSSRQSCKYSRTDDQLPEKQFEASGQNSASEKIGSEVGSRVPEVGLELSPDLRLLLVDPDVCREARDGLPRFVAAGASALIMSPGGGGIGISPVATI